MAAWGILLLLATVVQSDRKLDNIYINSCANYIFLLFICVKYSANC